MRDGGPERENRMDGKGESDRERSKKREEMKEKDCAGEQK